MRSDTPLLELRDVRVIRGRRRILDGLSLALRAGTVVAIVGPNGSGKTTLLRVLAGLTAPDAGAVRLDGRPLADLDARALAMRRAVLSQERPAEFGFTVRELAALGGRAAATRRRPDGLASVVAQALHRTGMTGLAGDRIDRLSGGERQRAHLARALVQLWSGSGDAAGGDVGGGILLMDEPLSAQDLARQFDILDLAREHADTGGLTVIVLHDLNAAASAADRIIVLDQGRIAADGTPEAVLTAAMLEAVFHIRAAADAGRAAVPAIVPGRFTRITPAPGGAIARAGCSAP